MQDSTSNTAQPPGGPLLYRVVLTNPPTVDDFKSKAELGLPAPPAGARDVRQLWDGISVFSTEAQARRAARRYPLLGSYVARLQIPSAAEIRSERTLASPGHDTLWGDSSVLLAFVTEVVPV